MELALAMIGIAGTLIGTYLGSWMQLRQQREQRAAEDRTRFHAVRLEAYATYIAVLRRFTVYVYRWRDQASRPVSAEQRALVDELQNELWTTVERVALLASPNIVRIAEDMYSDINILVSRLNDAADERLRLDAFNAFFKEFFSKRNALRDAMRQELDIKSGAGS
jgi:hypothetical protein